MLFSLQRSWSEVFENTSAFRQKPFSFWAASLWIEHNDLAGFCPAPQITEEVDVSDPQQHDSDG